MDEILYKMECEESINHSFIGFSIQPDLKKGKHCFILVRQVSESSLLFYTLSKSIVKHDLFGPAKRMDLSFPTFCLSVSQSVSVSVLAETAPDQYDVILDSALRYTKRFQNGSC